MHIAIHWFTQFKTGIDQLLTSISSNKIKSHGPRSGATKDTANDYSESGFADDPIKWTQVWVLPNYTDEGTALGVWANMSDTFGDGGTDMMSFFYADPQ